MAYITEKWWTEDRPLKGARSFRSRSAGPIGPFKLFRSFRSRSSLRLRTIPPVPVQRAPQPMRGTT